jgi:hypothetical protein
MQSDSRAQSCPIEWFAPVKYGQQRGELCMFSQVGELRGRAPSVGAPLAVWVSGLKITYHKITTSQSHKGYQASADTERVSAGR